ncbi:GerAB/ArcD/ProY family transporter [Paenibacillus beijingensis]|uniref:Spore gernimation protein n=1 Tax=Paenibacillus beijingensis TaxID=1126833 RepID=A0A0D5NN58_9BACL|nr:GerAB/ArcD/ProY family transporter [Paenibacillus beijingensis]AJY76691.1 spore gernimation protein [Paenibacillus beijingensis]
MERISKYQLGTMIILFEIGSTPLFELGIKAQRDAWIAVLLSILFGLVLLLLFLALQKRDPELNLIQMMIKYWGPVIGRVTAFLYIVFFAYESMRNVRDFGDLTLMTFLSRSPISMIMGILIFLSMYAIYKGIETFFRVSEFMVLGVISFYLALCIMAFISGIVDFKQLLPMLEYGVLPVVTLAASDTVFFPFGQMVLFLMFWSYVKKKEGLAGASFGAYLVSSTVILISNIMNLAVLGVHYTSISMIPLLQNVQLIQIARVFERFDALVILLFYVGIFIKATLWYLAAVMGLGEIFNTDYRKMILPVGIVIYSSSFLEPDWTYHLWLGHFVGVTSMVNPIFLVFLPLLLFLVMLMRRKLMKASADQPEPGLEQSSDV